MSIASPSLIGQKFGRLTARANASRIGGRRAYLCVCDCGETTIVRAAMLRSGNTKSCGCLRSDLSSARCRRLNGNPVVSSYAIDED